MIDSPCINKCRISDTEDICLGCKRTLVEIANWRSMTDKEKEAVLDRLFNQ